jgi:hypothetical protein
MKMSTPKWGRLLASRSPSTKRHRKPFRTAIEAVQLRRLAWKNVPKPPSLSQTFEFLIRRAEVETLSLGQILDSLAGRGHALIIVFLSFPVAQPFAVPGMGGILGVPLAFVSFFLLLGREPWIPEFMRRRVFRQDRLLRVLNWMTGLSRRIERLLHPRLPALSTNTVAIRVAALYMFIFAVVLALPVPVPVPFSNPVVAIPILFVGLGMLEKDGLFILFGYLSAIVSIAYYAGIFFLGDAIFDNWAAIQNAVLHFFGFGGQ